MFLLLYREALAVGHVEWLVRRDQGSRGGLQKYADICSMPSTAYAENPIDVVGPGLGTKQWAFEAGSKSL